MTANTIATAAAAIGPIYAGMECFLLTTGKYSIVDILSYLAYEAGPCSLTVSTWTASSPHIDQVHHLLSTGRITDCRWLVGNGFHSGHAAKDCTHMRTLFGDASIRSVRLHSKFLLLQNAHFSLSVRTSGNLNRNPRAESVAISDDRSLADFLAGEIDLYFREQEPGIFSAEMRNVSAGGIHGGRATGKRIFHQKERT